MSALFRALRLGAPLAARQRSYNMVSIPCRNKTSTGELIVLGSMIVGSITIVPVWVLVHLREYNGKA